MLQFAKRAGSLALAVLLLLMLLPTFAVGAAKSDAGTLVETTFDFSAMESIEEGRNDEEKAASKAKVKEKLEAAGLVEVENLFLRGNWGPIVNPGGYNGQGWYIQKGVPASGETIKNATLSLTYWVATGEPQGYIEVWASADNKKYEKVFEQKEGNGDPYDTNTRQDRAISLPVKSGQKEIYVKVVMEHFSTYEGAAVAVSTLAINRDPKLYEPVKTDKSPEELTMVSDMHSFKALKPGEVTAEDLGAVDELNMFFGIDGVPLLSPRNGYEIASATWKLSAAEGEPLNDCVLTMVGRTWWISESVKNDNYLKVYASTDGKTYTMVKELRSNDNMDDTQKIIVDVTDVVKGYAQAYVKLEWLVFDSPHIFGMRSVTLTGNTAGVDNSAGVPSKMPVSNSQCFTSLPVGAVDKAAVEAEKSGNLYFGYNKTPLLTATEAGEDAYGIWKVTAMDGETFDDCWLTLVGRFGYVDESLKDTSSIKISLSTDKEKYNEVKVITPTDDQSDTQKIAIDLSSQTYGLTEVYIKVYWSSKDDPSAMGLRSLTLVANAGADYDAYTPELEDRVIGDDEMPPVEDAPTDTPSDEPDNNDGQQTDSDVDAPKDEDQPKNGWFIWVIIAAAVVVVAGGGFCVWWFLLRKKAAPAEETEEAPTETDGEAE